MSKEMKKPEKGGTPKRITTRGEPGGPYTPGAKAKRRKQKAIEDRKGRKGERKRY